MKKKSAIPVEHSNRILNAGSIVLLTATFEKLSTISTIAWQMPVSKSPGLIALSIFNKGYSLELIKKSKIFCINLPDSSLLNKVRFCGSHSGRDINKFNATGLTPLKCKEINTFFIDECVAHIECSLSEVFDSGDHKIVIGKVVSSYIDELLFNKNCVIDLNRIQLIHHLGGNHFGVLSMR